DTAAFAGNRIGFQLLNDAAIQAEKYGVDKIDYLLGPYTGRALAPLATIDLVGLDVHKAIVDNVVANVKDERIDTYKMPAYMQKMIDAGMLGRKAKGKGGYFNRDAEKNKTTLNIADLSFAPTKKDKIDWVEKTKQAIQDGMYPRAIDLIKNAPGEEGKIVRYFILGYVAYSFARIGEVTPEADGIHGIDRVMSSGFSWLPPSGWVDLFGGAKETAALIEKAGIPVPAQLKAIKEKGKICRVADVSKFLIGR
ncbi:MAG TPA: 3-hydroxyacyl-CoA dehydrogenase family protein, partial [Turneriella sp.]|nr:3-hydroxyacyl-CoA dehydrogenase family protein [Turneriella sp.]